MKTFLMFLLVLVCCRCAQAQVTVYSNKSAWQQAVGEWQTIDFTGHPNHTLITDQYTHLGVRFTDGADFIQHSATYANDGMGLRGGLPASITIEFNSSLAWFGIDFPGTHRIELYKQGQIIYSNTFIVGPFFGVVVDEGIDKVRVFDTGSEAAIDDLYFGPPIPGPGALLTIMIAAACTRRRRRLA